MLKYKIPFEKKIFIDQIILTLPFIYSDERTKINNSIIFTSLMFGVGIIILLFGSELSTLFFAVGFFGIFDLYSRQERYKIIKDNHVRIVRDYADLQEQGSIGTFEFRNECIRFSTDYICTWINWNDFENYKILKSNLLLIPKVNKEDIIVIGQTEITEVEFTKVVEFVKSKLG